MAAVKTANVNARIQADIKQRAEAILAKMGLPRSVAIDMFYRQIIMHNGIPFPVNVPSPILSRDEMTNEEFNAMLLNGYEQAKADDSFDLDDVFYELKKGLK